MPRLCTAMDPRFKLALWDIETADEVTRQLVALAEEFEANQGVAEPAPEQDAKRQRVLAKHDSHDDWLRGMQAAAKTAEGKPQQLSSAKRRL